MLALQQNTTSVISDELTSETSSIFLTCPQLSAYMNTRNSHLLVIDCGSPLRHTERRIQHSLLLNANDKISRKRLSTRGFKNFLDGAQLARFANSEIIVLYDDTIRTSTLCSNASLPSQLSPALKSIYDEIKKYDANKQLYILQSSFDEFHQLYPALCYMSVSTDEDAPEPETHMDIDLCPLSEIFPGLYLGNSRDAEDLETLQKQQVHVVINVSTSIPCYFEHHPHIEYRRLPCHDSANQNILQYFESTFEYIHQKLATNKNVLVHCQGGVSRSPSFIIGYLMRYHSKNFEQAYEAVRQQRKIVNPNLNFVGQLTQYQQMLLSA